MIFSNVYGIYSYEGLHGVPIVEFVYIESIEQRAVGMTVIPLLLLQEGGQLFRLFSFV